MCKSVKRLLVRMFTDQTLIYEKYALALPKVLSAEVGKVGPQGFAEFFAAEQSLPPSPVTRRGPSEKFS